MWCEVLKKGGINWFLYGGHEFGWMIPRMNTFHGGPMQGTEGIDLGWGGMTGW